MTQPAGLIVFDMDSTLIQIECIDQIASLTGAGQKVAAITEQAMQGNIDFATSLRQRVECLKGVNLSAFEQLFSPIPFTPGAQYLLSRLQHLGWKTAVVSGGFTWFAERVATALQLDDYRANQLIMEQQQLSGQLMGEMVDAQYKATYLRELQQRWSIPAGKTVAVGDGANDVLMLESADVGIAFCAKPALRAVADVCIETHDLSRILPALIEAQLVPQH